MLKSYVAIATPSGLASLVPEHHLATPALVARAVRNRSVCCWAVLPDDVAEVIEASLASGEAADALAMLEAAVVSVGRIVDEGGLLSRG